MRMAAARIYRTMGAFANGGTPVPTTFHILTESGNNIAAENNNLLRTE